MCNSNNINYFYNINLKFLIIILTFQKILQKYYKKVQTFIDFYVKKIYYNRVILIKLNKEGKNPIKNICVNFKGEN